MNSTHMKLTLEKETMHGFRTSKVKGETHRMNEEVTWGSRGVKGNQKLLKVIIF